MPFLFNTARKGTPRLMLASCMQTPLRTNDLLNAIKYVFTPDDSGTLQRAFPGILAARQPSSEQALMPADIETETGTKTEISAAPEGGSLAGDAYYAAKDQLIMDEQVLLRMLRFSINIEHPHKYLLNMCHLLGCSQPLAHLATCLVGMSSWVSWRRSPLELCPILVVAMVKESFSKTT